jgi:hypothetical protein
LIKAIEKIMVRFPERFSDYSEKIIQFITPKVSDENFLIRVEA